MASRPSTPGTPSRRPASAATSPTKATRHSPRKAPTGSFNGTQTERPKSMIPTSTSSESLSRRAAGAKRPASSMGLRPRSSNTSLASTNSGSMTRSARPRPNNGAATAPGSRSSSPVKHSAGRPSASDGSQTESETDGEFESCASASEAEREGGFGDDDGGSDTETETEGNAPTKAAASPRKQSSTRSLKMESKDGTSENVVVCVRVRPQPSTSLSDIDSGSPDNASQAGTWLLDPPAGKIALSDKHPIIERRGTGTAESVHGSEGYEFHVDQVFPPASDTETLYAQRVSPVVRSAMEGFNGTVFAYGQTGSGKTWTMMGNDEAPGVIPRAVEEIFEVIRDEDDSREFLLRVSYLEIYNEMLRDLLEPEGTAKLDIRIDKGRVQVSGLKEEVVTHPMQVLETIARGEKARHVGATDWNERSSRSHTIFSMTIESRERTSSPSLAAIAAGSSGMSSAASLSNLASASTIGTRISSLNLIDLAGSESAATDQSRRKEGAFINKSLLALGTVIAKLTERGGAGAAHIPYRDSKLTRLLQTSLGGNAKVVVVCTISPNAQHAVESVSTLRFARRAKMVVTKAERGTTLDSHSALLQKYQQEILDLRNRLQANEASLGDSLDRNTNEERKHLDGLRDERRQAEEDIAGMQLQRIRLQEQIEHLNRRILTNKSVEANVRRASIERGAEMTPGWSLLDAQTPRGRKSRISDIGFAGSSPGGGLVGLGLRGASSRTQLASIMEAVGSPRAGTVKEAALERRLDEAQKASAREIDSRDDRIQELEHEVQTLHTRLAEAAADLEASKAAASEHEGRITELDTSILSLRNSLERVQKEKKELLEEQDQTKGLNTTQAERVSTLETKVSELETSLDQAQAEKTTSARLLEERTSRLALLEGDVRDLKLAVSNSGLARDLHAKQLERRDAELAIERTTIATLRSELDDIAAATRSASAQIEEKQQELSKERDRAQKEAADLKARVSETQQLFRVAQEEAKSRASELEEEARKKRQEADLAKAENMTLRAELDDVKSQLALLKDQQKHSIQVASVYASAGPNTDGLKAKLAALQRKQTPTISPPNSAVSLPDGPAPAAAVAAVAKPEEVEELRSTVDKQQQTIEKLQSDLVDARRQAAETLRADLMASASSSPRRMALQHTTSMREPAGGRSAQSPAGAVSAAAETEINRLNGVIESQKNMMSDARLDMSKWQARVRAQAQLIAQLQEGVDDPIVLGSPLSTPTGLVRRETASPSKSKLSFAPTQATPTKAQGTDSPFSWVQRALSPTGQRMTGPPSPSKANDYTYRDSPCFDGSPKPLPLPPGVEDERGARKGRRTTIDKDMEKLKQETLVERKKSVLLSPRSTPVKERRVLSGLGIRAAKMSADDRPLAPWEEARSPSRAGMENADVSRGKKRSTDSEKWYE